MVWCGRRCARGFGSYRELACEGSEGAAGGDSTGAGSVQAARCFVTVSQDFCSFGRGSIASDKHILGSCRPRGQCGVIGGEAKGLGGVQVG
jgi:hypothetical protein